jgi:putative ABC transport system permease protein
MPFYLSIALKNIFRDKRRSFTLGINYFFVALVLLVVFSITQGVQKNITDNVITSTAGHITIAGEYIVKGRTYQGIRNYPAIDSAVRVLFPTARVVTRYTVNSAVYHKGLSKRLSFVGIRPASDQGLRDQITIREGGWEAFVGQPNAVIIPANVADYFGLVATDEVLVSTRSRFGAFNTATFQVAGIYRTANYFVRDLLISHFDFLAALDLADSITASKMYLFFDDTRGLGAKRDLLINTLKAAGFIAIRPANDNDALNAVSAASPRYKVQDESINQVRLTLATVDEVTGIVSKVVATVNAIGLFVAAIMLFIIALSIFINMRMSISERLAEIGTLRAMGAERREIVGLFITENIFLSLLFVGLGLGAGLGLVAVFSTLVSFPADGVLGLFLNKGHFVLRPTAAALGFIAVAVTFFTALFSYFPARYGGRIPVVLALSKKE